MSMFSDFAGGFVGGVQKVVDANMEEERAASRYKKQLEIQEELRKKAEETRVAATRMFAQNGDMGPPELMAQDVNARGLPVGSARPASQFEKEDHATRNQMAANERALAADKRMAEMEDRTMKQEKHKSSLERDKASIASSRANAENLKSDGMSGRPKAQDEAVLWKDINNLMSDPNYRAAVEAGDASVLREFQPEDSVVKGLRSVAGMAGVPVPGNSGPSILEELQAEQDPVVRAQMLAGFKRRLEQAAARGLSAGKGVKPQKQ